MKKITLLFILISFVSFSQGSISNVSMSPVSPTLNDTIYIYVDMTFSTSSCELDTKNIQVNGTSILANSHHCLGMLQTICNITDTFTILPLPAANYNFNLVLTSGLGQSPCTPGIVPDTTLTFDFTVQDFAEIHDITPSNISVFPNPSNGSFTFELPSNYNSDLPIYITNIFGEIVFEKILVNRISEIELNLSSGIYFVFEKNKTSGLLKKIVIK